MNATLEETKTTTENAKDETIELRADPLISFIVPVYKVPKDTLKKCIRSLLTQDYPNLEVIAVFDGPDEELRPVVTEFLPDNPNLKVLEIEHAGACAARNAGFNVSSGEIVSFFNSDYIAKPGMAKLWVDALLDHPDCGFVYGGYEYATRDRYPYESRPFDEFALTQANYIDCGFPIWRKHVVEWDKDVKSLQDWDFWLRVVRSGVKGYYIRRDISFIAELPRDGGLSNDSHTNWLERVKFIKTKNNIPMSDLVVTSIGAPNHGIKIAQMLKADFLEEFHLTAKQNAHKAVYMIGFYIKPTDIGNGHPRIMAAFKNRIKIIHFVGADIYWLKKFSQEGIRMISGMLNADVDHLLCENRKAQEELKELGIFADILPIPPYNDYELKPLPEQFSVGIFLTDYSDFDKYCQKETLSIVRTLEDVQFHAYGDACQDVNYPNLKHYGNMDLEHWKQFVYDTSCYLRIVRHDTRPMASDEFMLTGRDVITNVPAPGVELIDTSGDLNMMQFDDFQTGLNDYRWPSTKKDIVTRILELRKNPKPLSYRKRFRKIYEKELNRENYIKAIYRMAKLGEAK